MVVLTLKEVLKKAIGKEIEAQVLYISLSQKVDDAATKETFQELAWQEQGHQRLLENYQRGKPKKGALDGGQNIDYKIAEKLEMPEVSPDMKLKDAFMLAARREKMSHELYLGLARIHPAGKVRDLFKKLAAQELGHKQRVEFLYTEVAFPQTDGG